MWGQTFLVTILVQQGSPGFSLSPLTRPGEHFCIETIHLINDDPNALKKKTATDYKILRSDVSCLDEHFITYMSSALTAFIFLCKIVTVNQVLPLSFN
jgi:hypothetical protein